MAFILLGELLISALEAVDADVVASAVSGALEEGLDAEATTAVVDEAASNPIITETSKETIHDVFSMAGLVSTGVEGVLLGEHLSSGNSVPFSSAEISSKGPDVVYDPGMEQYDSTSSFVYTPVGSVSKVENASVSGFNPDDTAVRDTFWMELNGKKCRISRADYLRQQAIAKAIKLVKNLEKSMLHEKKHKKKNKNKIHIQN